MQHLVKKQFIKLLPIGLILSPTSKKRGRILLRQHDQTTSPIGEMDVDSAIAQTYRPIIRGYFIVAAAYYVIMSFMHFWAMSGPGLLMMASASITASIVFIGAALALRKPLAIGKLELLTSLANLAMLGNVLVALHIEYAQPKLVYFLIMAMIYGFACVSMRQATVSIAAVLGGLLYQLITHDPAQLMIYGFIAFAAAMSALAITYFLRRAIGLAVIARHKAELKLKATETHGEKMRRKSLSDSLTGLPNRRAFFETLQAPERSGQRTCRLADPA